MQYNFNENIDRRNTRSIKWDKTEKFLNAPDVLPLWVADMDFASPPAVVQALKQRLEHPVFGYHLAERAYYSSIINWMETHHHWHIEKGMMHYIPGVLTGLNFAIQTFTEPGDKILIQPPVYRPFFETIEKNKRQVLEHPLKYENGRYTFDFELLEEMAKQKPKMLILCSPHNPVGRVWSREELQRLGEWCVEHNVLIVSDEIHMDLVYEQPHIPIASISKKVAENSITLISPAKTFNIQVFQIATAIIPSPALSHHYMEYLERFSLHLMNDLSIIASQTAYTEGAEWLQQLLQYLKSNRDYLHNYFKENLPEIKLSKPEGTYLQWLDFNQLQLTQEELNERILKKAKVGLLPGTVFGRGGEGFMRLNFATRREILEEALEKIKYVF